MARRKKASRKRKSSRGGQGWKLMRPSTWHWFPRWVFYILLLIVVVKLFKFGKTKVVEMKAKKEEEKAEKALLSGEGGGGSGSGGAVDEVKSVIQNKTGKRTDGSASTYTGTKGGGGGAGGMASKLSQQKLQRDTASKLK